MVAKFKECIKKDPSGNCGSSQAISFGFVTDSLNYLFM